MNNYTNARRRVSRVLAAILCGLLMLGALEAPLPAAAAQDLCAAHSGHDASCGYMPANPGSPCMHEHDGTCGAPVATPCNHVHDTCGYRPADAGSPCTHSCALCEPAAPHITFTIAQDEHESTALYIEEGAACTEADLLAGVSAHDETGTAVNVAVKDTGGLVLADPVFGGFPPTPYTVTYEAVHPQSGEAFTASRDVYVTLPILALSGTKVTLDCGVIRMGTITVKSGGVDAGTFTYVYTSGLYTNEYLLANIHDVIGPTYTALLQPTCGSELAFTNWYANYAVTGPFSVDTVAAGVQGSWADVDTIIGTLLGATAGNVAGSPQPAIEVAYTVSDSNSYEVIDGALVKSDKTGVTTPSFEVTTETANAVLPDLGELTVKLSGTGGRITLNPQTPAGGYAFYYATSASKAQLPVYGAAISSVSGAAVYSAAQDVGARNDEGVLHVQVYKVETTGNTIVGYGAASARDTLDCGDVRTGTITVKSNGVMIGTFTFVYTDGLYINEYLLEGLQNVLKTEYANLLKPTVGAELIFTDWYANYAVSGSFSVNAVAAGAKGSWADVDAIVGQILGAAADNTVTGRESPVGFEYEVSMEDSYEVIGGSYAKSGKQLTRAVQYVVAHSTADALVLPANAKLTVNGTDLVAGGAVTGASVAGASYSAASGALTLTNYSGGAIVASEMDLNLVLVGSSTVTGSESMGVVRAYSFDNSPKLTIAGSGSLTVNNTKTTGTAYGIFGWKGVAINGGTVTVNMLSAGYTYGIGTNRAPITIDASKGANVTVTVAGGSSAAHALVGSAVTVGGDAVIKEGDTAAGAQTVNAITLTAIDVGEASKKHVSVTPTGTPSTYTLTVQNGSGGGSYASGQAVTITANTPPEGKVFDRWVTSGGGSFASAASASTTFTMPAGHVTVTATYKDQATGDSSSEWVSITGYSRRTLTDAGTGVSVSGSLADGATLVVRESVPHARGTCSVCDALRAHSDAGELAALYDISIIGGYSGELEVTITVGSRYNGYSLKVMHCDNQVDDTQTQTVRNGQLIARTTSLSPFGVLKPGVTPRVRVNPPMGRDVQSGRWLWALFPAALLAVTLVVSTRRRKANR